MHTPSALPATGSCLSAHTIQISAHRLLDAGSLALYDFHFPNNWVLGINNGRYGPDHYLNAIVAKFLPLPNYAEVGGKLRVHYVMCMWVMVVGPRRVA